MAIASIAKRSKWFSNKLITFPRFPCKHAKKSLTAPLSPCMPKTTSKESEFREVFRFFDNDNDGKISNEELRAYFGSIGESMSYDEAQRVITEFDINGDGLLEFTEFVKLMERDGKDDDELKRAFEIFEVDKGCGCITPKGLQQVLNRLGNEKSDEECEAMIRVFDLDGNGVLDFHEFHKMMS